MVAPTACPDPAPRYPEIASIIEARCASCHSGALSGPWPLHDYSHLADWRDELRDQIRLCTMPPPEARVPITDEERLRILSWIRCGLPE